MLSSVSPVSDGARGIAEIVAQCNALREFYGRVPAIRSAALTLAPPRCDDDKRGQLAQLAAFVRVAMRYVADPFNAEFIQTPDRLLLEINERGYAHGDCDDSALLFAALAESVGVACEIVSVNTGAGSAVDDHVLVLAQVGGETIEFDLIQK